MKDRKARWRLKHPMKAAYQTLRQNARRRKKEFDLTFEDFKKFCFETEYMSKKGIYKKSYHIDRIDPDKGYTLENIRVLTNSENVKRERARIKTDVGHRWVTITRDCAPVPF